MSSLIVAYETFFRLGLCGGIEMKYVRTKAGIYEVSKIIKDRVGSIIQYKIKSRLPNTKLGVYGRLADTLEELCDEFVGIDSEGHYILHNDEFMEGARIVPLEKVNYYGAIWTDKGLIYVAKMNEKGELELL